jgi:hypothetical protein
MLRFYVSPHQAIMALDKLESSGPEGLAEKVLNDPRIVALAGMVKAWRDGAQSSQAVGDRIKDDARQLFNHWLGLAAARRRLRAIADGVGLKPVTLDEDVGLFLFPHTAAAALHEAANSNDRPRGHELRRRRS